MIKIIKIRNNIKFYFILLLSVLIVGCSESDLINVSNDGRLIKISDIYDCRVQNRHPWGDSPHTELITHLIDFGNKKQILHKGYYRDTILNSTHDYKLSVVETDDYEFLQIFYDIEEVEETNNFVRFVTVSEKGNRFGYVINKSNMSLSPTNPNKNLTKEQISYGISFDWTRNCRKI